MNLLIKWLKLILITFGVTLIFLLLFSVIKNGFDFSNFFAKLFVFFLVLTTNFGIVKLILWDKEIRNQNFIIMFITVMFWLLFWLNISFGEYVYTIEKEYVGLSARKTNKQDYIWTTEYGERGEAYDYKKYYYLDPTIKSFVIKRNSDDYNEIKKLLLKRNKHIQEKKYQYWHTAVVDGYYSKNTCNSIEKGFFYFIELCHKTVPTLIFVFIINLVLQISTSFKYSFLGVIYRPLDNEVYEEDKEHEEDEESKKFWDDFDKINEK